MWLMKKQSQMTKFQLETISKVLVWFLFRMFVKYLKDEKTLIATAKIVSI